VSYFALIETIALPCGHISLFLLMIELQAVTGIVANMTGNFGFRNKYYWVLGSTEEMLPVNITITAEEIEFSANRVWRLFKTASIR
jgi:hypothetical protein